MSASLMAVGAAPAHAALADLHPLLPLPPYTCPRPAIGLSWADVHCTDLALAEARLGRAVRSWHRDADELQQYGQKYAGLVRMHKAVEAMGLDVKVPLPRGLASGQIVAFLQKEAPKAMEGWATLGKWYRERPQGFWNRPEVSSQLSLIDQEMARAFHLFQLPQEMQWWLGELRERGAFAIVRSTGAEDGNVANAGGHTSHTYVEPNGEAVGTVVRSYVGKRSLQNRMAAGIDPFEGEFEAAVLMQEFIGEADGKPPVSFVLFTQEPHHTHGEAFRVMTISATWGHGEGVVGNQGIGTDTILVLRSAAHPDRLHIIYENGEKPERLAPCIVGNRVQLEKRPNGDPHARALTDAQIVNLYRSGVAMEAAFHEATDIEGVIRDGKVHFVQARRINRKPLRPSYLEQTNIEERLQAETHVAGKAGVIEIGSQEEIAHANYLEEAAALYRANPMRYKLIAFTQPEPKNSHPTVNLSEWGVPCLYVSDKTALERLLAKVDASHPLAVCMQTATLNLMQGRPVVRDGFAVHPAKISISLPVPKGLSFPSMASGEREEVKTVLAAVRDEQKTLEDLQEHAAFAKLRRYRAELEHEFHRMERPPEELEYYVEALKTLDMRIVALFEEIGGSVHSVERLFYLKELESLLIPGRGDYSLLDAEPLYRAGKWILETWDKVPAKGGLKLLLMGTEASPEARKAWTQLLTEIGRGKLSEEEWTAFAKTAQAIHKAGVAPMWLTFFQPKTVAECTGFKHKETMHALLQDQQFIRTIQSRVESFAHPDGVRPAWESLGAIARRCTSPQWIASVKNGPPLIRAVAAETMYRLVELFDTAAKTVKTSSAEGSTKLWHEMIERFASLPERWTLQWLGNRIPTHTTTFGIDFPHEDYFDTIGKLWQHVKMDRQPSEDFSVAHTKLGSRTTFNWAYPKTLEDFFTLAHQNGLECVSTLNHHSVEHIQASHLPAPLKKGVVSIESSGLRVQRAGLHVDAGQAIVSYNMPIRDHGSRFALHYDMRTQKMVFRGAFLGFAMERWNTISSWIRALAQENALTLAAPVEVRPMEMRFAWEVRLDNLPTLLDHYQRMANYSLEWVPVGKNG